MEKWSLNKLEIEAVKGELSEDIVRDLKTPVAHRRGFRHNPYVVTIPRYYYRFIGIKGEEEEYYETLYRIDRELRNLDKLYLRFDSGMDKSVGLNIQNKLIDVWSRISPGAGMDTGLLISLLYDHEIVEELPNMVLSLQLKNNFRGLIDYYLKVNTDVKVEETKLIVNSTVYWIHLYLRELLANFDYGDMNPKILFYGDISKEECFFLNLLGTLGFDILYFNPKNSGKFLEVDRYNYFSKEVLYSQRREIKTFPEAVRGRVKTTAYTAKEELNRILFNEESNLYRAWQFADYSVKAVTLKTTYEEVNLWGKESAMIRDGWKTENGKVFIPNIFAKVCGTHEDLDKYWKEVNGMVNHKNTILYYKKLPIIDVVPLEYGKYEYVFPSSECFDFDLDRLIKAPWWKYRELRTGLQRAMAQKIKELCINPVIMNVENADERDFQVDIFSVLINLDIQLQQMLQSFDYPGEIPKIIIYNNEKNGNLSYEDCIMLTFMNSMGVDIIIYNPSGYNDVENYIYSELYDIHRLENMSFNLDFKRYNEKKGFFKSLFG